MNHKKYILFTLLIINISIGKAFAYETATCRYVNDLNKPEATAILEMHWGFDVSWLHNARGGLSAGYSTVWFQNMGSTTGINDREGILNWYKDFTDNNVTGMVLSKMYDGSSEANKNPKCPTYLMMRGKKKSNGKYNSFGAFSTNSLQTATSFVNNSNQHSDYDAWYLVHKDSTGNEITQEQYNSASKIIFNNRVKTDNYNINIGGEDAKIDCKELFGDKKDPKSISYLINEILKYPRYIIPAILVLFGTLDFGKAVISSKEEEMKKAQNKFIKRVIISVAIFLVPLIMNIIMHLADIVWEGLGYSSCNL